MIGTVYGAGYLLKTEEEKGQKASNCKQSEGRPQTKTELP
jgi:hypothetical protein